MVSPPILVSKGNVMIGYNPIYEYAALPDVERIVAAIRSRLDVAAAVRVSKPGSASRGGNPPMLKPRRLATSRASATAANHA